MAVHEERGRMTVTSMASELASHAKRGRHGST